MSSSVQKLIRNIFANQAGFLVSVAVTFLLSPFVVNSLGGARYGIWSLIVSFTGNYGLLAFGIQAAMTRYIAHSAATGDKERVNGYINAAVSFLIVSAILTLLIGGVVAQYIEDIFVIPKDFANEAQKACMLISFSAAATFIFAAFESIMIAHQRFQITTVVGTISTVIRAGMTVWLLKHGYGIAALAALGAFLTLLNGAVNALIVKKMYPYIRLTLSSVRRSHLKELMDYGYKSFTVAIAVALIYQCDLLVIGTYLSPEYITVYSLASTLITYMIRFVSAIAHTLGPYATELHAREKTEELRTFFIKGSCLMYMLGGLIVAGCMVFGKAFFTLWVGPKYAESANILAILVIPHFFATGARIGSSLLVGMARIGPLAAAAICEGISNLVLSFILVRYLGLVGVALGTLIPCVLNNGIWLPLYVSRVAEVQAMRVYQESMLTGIGIGIGGFLIGRTVSNFFIPETWGLFLMDVAVTAVFSAVLACIIFSYTTGKYYIRNAFARMTGFMFLKKGA